MTFDRSIVSDKNYSFNYPEAWEPDTILQNEALTDGFH